MSGATVGILYTKSIYLGTGSSLASSMFTVRGNGITTRGCQPASVNNCVLDSKEQLISSRIRPLSHGVSLPQIPWQHSFHRTILVPPASKSRNNSAVLLSPSQKPSSFPNFRTLEQVESNNRLEDKVDKKQPMESYTSSVDNTDLLKLDKTLDFKTSDCSAVPNKDAVNDINLPTGLQKKKRHNFHKYNGKKSRCKNKKEHKKRKLRKQFNNDQQNALHSISSASHPVLQVQPVTKQKSSKEGSEDYGAISQTNSDSSSKSLRQSSSHTSLYSEVFQRASTIYSNLRKSCQEKEREKIKRVYLSEKQSGVIKDCGIALPCAPPCSPTIEQLANVEYILSMNDIRSQRAVKERLSQIENKSKKRELARKEEAKRIEKQYMKDQELIKKQRQRLEIYALNKIMTELEEKQFQQFCKIMKSDSNKSSASNNLTGN